MERKTKRLGGLKPFFRQCRIVFNRNRTEFLKISSVSCLGDPLSKPSLVLHNRCGNFDLVSFYEFLKGILCTNYLNFQVRRAPEPRLPHRVGHPRVEQRGRQRLRGRLRLRVGRRGREGAPQAGPLAGEVRSLGVDAPDEAGPRERRAREGLCLAVHARGRGGRRSGAGMNDTLFAVIRLFLYI